MEKGNNKEVNQEQEIIETGNLYKDSKICFADAKSSEQIEKIQKLYFTAFPENERKPFSLILKLREQGYFDILAIESEKGVFLGEAIVIRWQNILLLDYFAIAPEYRGKKIGSKALRLLQKKYKNSVFILEIESTKVECENKEQRVGRKNFYEVNGMKALDYCVDLFGVEMEIMACHGQIPYERYHELFIELFGEKTAEKVKLLEE